MRRVFPLVLLVACGGSSGSDDDSAGSSGAASTSSATTGSTGAPGTGSSTTEVQTASSSSSGVADSSSTGSPEAPIYEAPGPYGVGLQTSMITVGERELHVTFWYPSDDAAGTTALADLVPEAQSETLATLMNDAPADCVRADAEGVIDAPLAKGTFPIVMYSHCYSCLGLSSSFIAERVASHGSVVVGVSHTDGTLFDALDGNPGALDGEFLQVRAADVSGVLDAVSADSFIADAIDLERVGMFGHSFGATTTGLVLQEDDRFTSGVAIAAPIENPLLPGVATAQVDEPMLYLLMEEDNSISAVGNTLMRNNAMAMPGGSWLVELADAGHWSPSDLCGIIDDFMPCCGDDLRQTDGSKFTYLPADTGRSISAAYVTAFFAAQLGGDADAETYLGGAHPEDLVTVTTFPR